MSGSFLRIPLVAVTCVFCSQLFAQLPAEDNQHALKITVRNGDELSGVIHAQEIARFSSRMTATDKADLQISVGEVTLRAEADFLLESRTVDGGGHALSVEERKTLMALALALEESLDPYRQSLPAHEDFLFRVINLWSEAPVGWPLSRHVVTAPTEYHLEPANESGGCQSGNDNDPTESGCSTNDCNRRDNDGVTLLFGCDCFNYVEMWHDTKVLRWYGLACGHACEETLAAGCDLDKDCLGRCGAGCGSSGRGRYTVDCTDHDRCCRIHGGCLNPIALSCGDEYGDAIDDFLFASTNCTDGCSAGSGDDCGDGVCNSLLDEDTCTCPEDCEPSCQDNCCNGGETAETCAADCATVACCLPTNCCREDLLAGDCIGLNGTPHAGMSCTDIAGTCAEPPGGCPTELTTCGNGVCDAGEDSCNCSDCVTCGDGCCGTAEIPEACPIDCIMACDLPVGCCSNAMTLTDCVTAGGSPVPGSTCIDIGLEQCSNIRNPAIPTVGSWGVGILVLFLLGMGTVIFRERRIAVC